MSQTSIPSTAVISEYPQQSFLSSYSQPIGSPFSCNIRTLGPIVTPPLIPSSQRTADRSTEKTHSTSFLWNHQNSITGHTSSFPNPTNVSSGTSPSRYVTFNGGTTIATTNRLLQNCYTPNHSQWYTTTQPTSLPTTQASMERVIREPQLVGHVISERVVEHEVRIPKKIIREDIVEKVIVVPEKIVREEVIEDVSMVREKIIEVAKPVFQEKIIEVPEIEYVEKIVEIPEVIFQEKVREVPRIEIQERIIEVPKIVTQERVVEVPEIEYRELPIEKTIEVQEIHEQVILKQIPIPQYIDRPVPEYVNIEVNQEVIRHIPVPIETVTTIYLKVPKLRSRYSCQDVPLYVPRFIEIAMPAELMDTAAIAEAEHYAQQVAVIASQPAASLCEIERLAGTLKDLDSHYSKMMTTAGDDTRCRIANAWNSGRLRFSPTDIVTHQKNEKRPSQKIQSLTKDQSTGDKELDSSHETSTERTVLYEDITLSNFTSQHGDGKNENFTVAIHPTSTNLGIISDTITERKIVSIDKEMETIEVTSKNKDRNTENDQLKGNGCEFSGNNMDDDANFSERELSAEKL